MKIIQYSIRNLSQIVYMMIFNMASLENYCDFLIFLITFVKEKTHARIPTQQIFDLVMSLIVLSYGE